ncbi:MAG TPA: hypothetical protein VKN35_09840 [Xanthomonadales bacterium]|nr:hypothetical protein [Xanthomonadales bacterium]
MFQPDPWGILALIAVAMCWTLAGVLFRVSTPGSVARKLSLLLVVEGVTLGFSDAPMFLLTSPENFINAYPWFASVTAIIHFLGDCALLALYPAFLAVALQTKMTRVFSTKRARNGLLIAATLLFLFVISTFFIVSLSPFKTFSYSLLFFSLILTFGYAFVASIQAWKNATGAARSRALIFLLAFGFRDLCWGTVYADGIWATLTGRSQFPDGQVDFGFILYILGTLVAVPLIAYGILRTQLFDIDLRIRWTIKQSTLGFSIVSIIFLLSEGAEILISSQLGTVGGLVGAAVAAILFAPLKLFAERVASAAMPNTKNTPEYTSKRKLQVYESALAEALHEEGISTRERALLKHLRVSLGISETEAEAIESKLVAV